MACFVECNMIAMMFQKFDSKGCWVKILEKAKISLLSPVFKLFGFEMTGSIYFYFPKRYTR